MTKPRLSIIQKIWRQISLLIGNYTWSDGTIELDSDRKAGIDNWNDSQELQDKKFTSWLQRQQQQERDYSRFLIGAAVGGLVVWWWLRR